MKEVNLAGISYVDLENFIADSANEYKILVPIPSLGKTQSYRDICSDVVDALWLIELLASKSTLIEFNYDNSSPYYYYVAVTIYCEIDSLKDMLLDGVILFQYLASVDIDDERYEDIRGGISDFEYSLDSYETKFPELLDFYFSNYINGVFPEAASEFPEEYRNEINKHPEWKFGYWKSGYSGMLEAECFASCDGWIIPNDISLNDFFKSQKQKYTFEDLLSSIHFSLDGKSYLLSSNGLFQFPHEKYLSSKMVSALINDEDDDYLNGLNLRFSEGFYIDSSGTLLVVDDGDFYHVFYNVNSLRDLDAQKLQSSVLGLVSKISSSADLSKTLSLDWSKMTDDDFENLCYDIIYRHPKFNVNTIRKLGHSRSRDGGRDIEVYDIAMLPGETPVKWIFQCKLVSKAKSLGGSKVQDIGDMLEQYDAGGFGVMTSVLIDATLYNKMDSICIRRNIKQMNFSVLELERMILKDIAYFERYF